MFGLFSSRVQVLVAGSAHIDNIGERDINPSDRAVAPHGPAAQSLAPHIHATGRVTTSFGGCAYNIAVNLARIGKLGHDVGLFTVLPKGTVITNSIISSLERQRVNTSIVQLQDSVDDDIGNGGFVGIVDRERHELYMSTVRSRMDGAKFMEQPAMASAFEAAARRAELLVFDTGIDGETLEHAIESVVASSPDVPICLHIVSEEKAHRAVDALSSVQLDKSPLYSISGKVGEIAIALDRAKATALRPFLQSLVANDPEKSPPPAAVLAGRSVKDAVTDICAVLKTKHVLVTPRQGHVALLLSADGSYMRFNPLRTQPGAGGDFTGLAESMTAALIAKTMVMRRRRRREAFKQPLNLADPKVQGRLQSQMLEFSDVTMKCEGATPNSVLNFSEADILPPSWWERFIRRANTTMGTVRFLFGFAAVIYAALDIAAKKFNWSIPFFG